MRTAQPALQDTDGQSDTEPPWHDARLGGLPMLPALLTYARAAEELGYASPRSVARLVREGRLEVVGHGRGRRIPRESFLAYLAELRAGDK